MREPLTTAVGRKDFVEQHGLWNDEQHAAASEVEARLESLDFVRLVFVDPHGLPRSKNIAASVFRSVLRNGMDFSPGPFVFDTGHAMAVDFFTEGGGIGISELTGAGDFIAVPDPRTFRVLPHTEHRTGWVICDEYLRDGRPHPLSTRAALRRQCDLLAARDMRYVVGLEVEWYVTRYTDAGRVSDLGGFGVQSTPPAVEPVNRGYQFNSDALLDAIMPLIRPLVDALPALGLPLRSIEHESGPGQVETTFTPQDALAAADAMVLFRSVAKGVLARHGYHASFMALPGLAGFDPSGWHLHQSLAELSTGRNLFVAERETGVLSELGMHYLGGLLEHAVASSLLCVPTINGYRRMQTAYTLSPERAVWCEENRGTFLRVIDAGGAPGAHVENRIGEPAANPYLYLAAQVSAGIDGIDRKLSAGLPENHPDATEGALLPRSLDEAIAPFEASHHYREMLGGALHDCLRLLKTSEQTRYGKWLAQTEQVTGNEVTEWEHREYFAIF